MTHMFSLVAINVAQTSVLFMKKSAGDLAKEVKSLDAPEDAKMKSFFEETLVDCEKVIATHEEKVTQYSETVAFFGEQSSNDIAGFFTNWNKFITAFRAAVKFNVALNKKQEAEERKAKEEREKKKEEKNLKKFADTLRASRKTLPSEMLKAGQQMEEDSGEDASANKGRARRTRARKTKPTVSVVDDIISDNADFLDGPSADMRADNGVVKQISRGLRSGDTFSRLRGKRMAKKAPGGDADPLKPTDAPDVKRQLRSQKSTFSRRQGNRAKKEEKKEEKPGARIALTSINWG